MVFKKARLGAGAGLFLLALLFGAAPLLSQWLGDRQASQQARTLREQLRPGDLLMFSSDGCVYCAQARRWLEAEQLPYRECSIDRDAVCLRDFQARRGPGTPIFSLRGQTVVGFDRAALAAAALAGPR